MLTLSNLIQLTSNAERTFSRKTSYRIDAFDYAPGEDPTGQDVISVGAVISGGKDPRRAAIDMYASRVMPTANVKVSCTCPYFLYKLSLSLRSKGATDVQVSKQDVPSFLKGGQLLGLCPHLLLLSKIILNPHSSEMSRLRHEAKSPKKTKVSDKLRGLT